MPNYTMLRTARANDLEKVLKVDKAALDNLVKKKADKKVVQAARTKYGTDSKALAKLITDDITTARAGFATMSKYVDDTLNRAMKVVSEARSDLKTLTPGPKADAALRSYAGLGHTVEDLANEADQEITKYAVSWNEYRTANYELDRSLLTKFAAARGSIIDETIKVRVRHRKIEALAVEAVSLQNALFEKVQGYETSSENKVVTAGKLLASVTAAIKDLKTKNNPESLTGSARQFKSWVELDFDDFAKQVQVRGAAYNAAKATGQATKTTLSTLQRAVATARPTFTPQDLKENDELAAVVERIEQTVSTFEAEVKAGLRSLMEIAQLVNLAQVRIKRGS